MELSAGDAQLRRRSAGLDERAKAGAGGGGKRQRRCDFTRATWFETNLQTGHETDVSPDNGTGKRGTVWCVSHNQRTGEDTTQQKRTVMLSSRC